MGVTTQTGAATFNEIRQLQMIDRAASPAEHRTQKLMTAPLPKRISTASPPDPELGGEHTGRGHRIENEITAGAQALSSDRAIRVKLCWGCRRGMTRSRNVEAFQCIRS